MAHHNKVSNFVLHHDPYHHCLAKLQRPYVCKLQAKQAIITRSVALHAEIVQHCNPFLSCLWVLFVCGSGDYDNACLH